MGSDVEVANGKGGSDNTSISFRPETLEMVRVLAKERWMSNADFVNQATWNHILLTLGNDPRFREKLIAFFLDQLKEIGGK